MRSLWMRPLVVVFALALPVAPLFAQEIRQDRVRFESGATSVTVKGTIKGYDVDDYIVDARKGQTMTIGMTTTNGANYFDIIPPGETDVAMFNGSQHANKFTGAAPATGEYHLRVYLTHSAALRDEAADYSLTVSITGEGEK